MDKSSDSQPGCNEILLKVVQYAAKYTADNINFMLVTPNAEGQGVGWMS